MLPSKVQHLVPACTWLRISVSCRVGKQRVYKSTHYNASCNAFIMEATVCTLQHCCKVYIIQTLPVHPRNLSCSSQTSVNLPLHLRYPSLHVQKNIALRIFCTLQKRIGISSIESTTGSFPTAPHDIYRIIDAATRRVMQDCNGGM